MRKAPHNCRASQKYGLTLIAACRKLSACLIQKFNIPHFEHFPALKCSFVRFSVFGISPMHCKFLALFVADHQKSEYCLQVFECAPDKRLGLLYGEIVTGDWSTIRIADICKQVQARKTKTARVYLLPVTTRAQAELWEKTNG